MILPEAMRLSRGVYRRRRLTVPTLFVFGRHDRPWTEQNMGRISRNPEQYADRIEFEYVEDAAHFITDDAPARWSTSRSTGSNEQLDVGLTTQSSAHRIRAVRVSPAESTLVPSSLPPCSWPCPHVRVRVRKRPNDAGDRAEAGATAPQYAA